MDIRVAISRARVAARAVIRLATFAQAISSTNATKTPSAASERRFSFCKSETPVGAGSSTRSEEHTSELQSRLHLVCRLLLEKKKRDTEPARSSIENPSNLLYKMKSVFVAMPPERFDTLPTRMIVVLM